MCRKMETGSCGDAAASVTSLAVGKHSHPFWSSAVRSQLKLTMLVPPESQLLWLKLEVVSVNAHPAAVYKVSAGYASGQVDSIYCNQKEALAIVKKEWLCHYAARTAVEFVEHKYVDMSSFLSTSFSGGGDVGSSSGSNSGSGSPRFSSLFCCLFA